MGSNAILIVQTSIFPASRIRKRANTTLNLYSLGILIVAVNVLSIIISSNVGIFILPPTL